MLEEFQDLNFMQMDAQSLISTMTAMYEQAYQEQTGESQRLALGNPVRLVINTFALMFYQVGVAQDWANRQNYLSYASGDVLDYRAANFGKYALYRLPEQAAVTTLAFVLSNVWASDVVIPAGTRATAGDNVFFATTEVLTIPAGQTDGQVIARCTQSGSVGNLYAAGQINRIVDPIPFLATVINLTAPQGGAEVESDDHFRERIFLAPDGFSVAGPFSAYIFLAKSYSTQIIDVKPSSPSPGVVLITVILSGGELPTAAFLSGLIDSLSADASRPLTDHVLAAAPETVSYDIDATYWISAENATSEASIQGSVENALNQYATWQKSKIGRDITPSQLTMLIKQAGAKRVTVGTPVDTVLTDTQVALLGNVNLRYGGLEND